MEETEAAGGSTERPASSGRGIVDKALVKEALGELLQEIPAFREFSARRGSTEGQRQVKQGLASTSANAATAVDTTRTTTATVTQVGCHGRAMGVARRYSPC